MPGLKGRMIVQDLPKIIGDQSSEYGLEAMAHNFFNPQPVKVMNSRLNVLLVSPSFLSQRF